MLYRLLLTTPSGPHDFMDAFIVYICMAVDSSKISDEVVVAWRTSFELGDWAYIRVYLIILLYILILFS